MKRSYIQVYIIEILILVFLIFNTFVVNVLSNYLLTVFLFLSLILHRIFFNFEKDKHRNTKDVILNILIYLLIVLLVYYAIGIFTGYTKSVNYYTPYGIFNVILPIVLTIIISELLRYELLQKSEGNFKLIILTTIIFIFVDVSNKLFLLDLSSTYNIIIFLGLTMLPSISKNIFSTYISSKTGYKPVIIFNLFISLHKYLLPVVPNFNEYMQSIFLLIVPVIITIFLSKKLKNSVEDEMENMSKRRVVHISYIFEILASIILVYLISGYFKYFAIAIASNSMMPTFSKGSVAIVRKIDKDYSKLEVRRHYSIPLW